MLGNSIVKPTKAELEIKKNFKVIVASMEIKSGMYLQKKLGDEKGLG